MNCKNAVLVVDDDPVLLKIAGEILKESYLVSFAKSGQEALDLVLSDFIPDIILLDVDMPNLNGFETLCALRGIEDALDIPVIFLTAADTLELELKGLSLGAVDYITKPFVKKSLLARMSVHLENGKKLRQISIMEKNKETSYIDSEKFETLAKTLTETERKILMQIALGYSNQEIVEKLHYTYGYVKKVTNIIFNKLNFSRRNEIKSYFRR